MSCQKKSPIDALNKIMIKFNSAPIFLFLLKFGKSHLPWYRFSCIGMGEEVIGTGHSKREAKNIVATMMLRQLSLRGYKVPPEFACPEAMYPLMDHAGLPTHSFIVLVNELSRQYHLDPVEYEVMADPAGQCTYTVLGRIGHVERVATANSKKLAHQLAAEQIYRHLRTRLMGTRNINEEEVMMSAYDRAISEASDEESLADQRRRQEAAQAEAARQMARRHKKKKNRQRRMQQSWPCQAVEDSVRLEMEQSNSEPLDYDDLPARPPTPRVAPEVNDQVAMSFIEQTMNRLGI